MIDRVFPGGSVVKTSPSNAEAVGSSPGQGVKVPHASGPNIKWKQYCKKFSKDCKNSLHPKKTVKNDKHSNKTERREKEMGQITERTHSMRKDKQVIINLYTFKHVLKCCST